MNNERLTKFVLIVEIVAIVVLHVARSSSSTGVRDIASRKTGVVTPALQFKSTAIPFKSPIVLSVRK